MRTVYVETTIPSFYTDTRRSATIVAWREATRTWWDHSRHKYRLCTSAFVLAELERIPGPRGASCVRMLESVRLLDPTPDFDDVVRAYVRHRLMPRDAAGDAAHLALASLHGIDFLLTWNCRHLANMNKAVHLGRINSRLGLHVPTLTTPLTLMPEPER
ncbi:MAG: type II toxin-antitoxin system VapC family toxin [Phycisphaeraceae bacterium]|nr:type II toxin-antitoxin system VapC family toxin [Phycisphaeraceae bacterium]